MVLRAGEGWAAEEELIHILEEYWVGDQGWIDPMLEPGQRSGGYPRNLGEGLSKLAVGLVLKLEPPK
jgi:hypothetical protein